MNRLLQTLRQAKARKSKLVCIFLTLGYPNLEATKKIIRGCEYIGVDLIELGFPFSDPLADGPTIQYSSERALEKGVRLRDAFKLVSDLRREGCRIPLLFFGYLNPIFHFGFKRFAREAKRSGFDGLIVPDSPAGGEIHLEQACKREGLAQVFLIAPTTQLARASKIARHSAGFVYYVSLRGVTGARQRLSGDVGTSLARLRRVVHRPLLVGFGVSSPEQGRAMAKLSAGVIVGSAVVDRIRKSRGKTDGALRFIKKLVRSVKES